MADEPNRDGQPTDGAKPRLEPDQPTPNRDKRRTPPILDLKADAPVTAPARPTPAPAAASPMPSAKAAEPLKAPPGGESTFKPGSTPPKSSVDKAPIANVKTSTDTGASAKTLPPPQQERRSGSGLLAPLALLGVVLTAGAVGYGYVLMSSANKTISDLQSQVAGLTDRLDHLNGQAVTRADFDKRLASVDTTLTRLNGQVGGAATRADLDKRVASIEDQIGKRFAANEASDTKANADTNGRMQKLEAIRNGVTASLEKRVGSLEALTTTLGAQIDQASTKSEVVRIQAARAIEAVAKASASPPGAPIILPPTVDIAPVNAEIKKLQGSIAELKASSNKTNDNIVPVGAQLKQLESTVAELKAAAVQPKDASHATEARAVVPSPQADPANLAIVAQALVDAFDSGRPLAPMLASAKSLGAEAKTAALVPYAESGAPTLHTLAQELDALKPKMSAAVAPPPANTLFGRLSAGAASMITVEKTSDAATAALSSADGDIAAPLAKISSRLGSNDAAAAYGIWEKLPAKARQVSQGWADRLKQRVDAAAALQSFSTDTLAALGKTKT